MKRIQHPQDCGLIEPVKAPGRCRKLFCTTILMISVATVALQAGRTSAGEPGNAPGIIDYEAAQVLKNRLVQRTLLLEIHPEPGQYQDASLMPARFGQGAAVLIDGKAMIVTSSFLVDGARKILVVRPDAQPTEGGIRPITELSTVGFANDTVEARIERLLPEAGLALLELPADIDRALPVRPTVPGTLIKADPERIFWCVTSAAGGLSVLTPAAVVDVAGPPFEKLFLAPGSLPQGTVLFDADGTILAVAARESFGGSRFTLIGAVALAQAARPAAAERVSPEATGPAGPGIWTEVPKGD